jgi:hypothetical protein
LADASLKNFAISAAVSLPALAGSARRGEQRADPPRLDAMTGPTAAGVHLADYAMLSDKETRILEAALLAAMPVCVAHTAVIALLTLGRT